MRILGHCMKAGGVVRLFVLSFILSVSRITRERVNGHGPNVVGIGKGRDRLEVVDVGSVFHLP